MTTTNRTKKRSSDEDDFDVLRRYILACPTIANPKENAAVKAALGGLELELKRRERDAKLLKKFAASSAVEGKAVPESTNARQDLVDDSEWQDLADDRVSKTNNTSADRASPEQGDEMLEFVDMDGETSFLGKTLAEKAIASLAESKTRAKTPLAAMAAVLHGMLISSPIQFACTGSAHDKDQAKSAGGFAAPVRDLPAGQFLPKDWDRYASKSNDDAQQVVLRYRKQGTGAVLLRVELSKEADGPGKDISIKLQPAKTKEPPSQSLVFPLEDHLNLDSWNAALRASSGSAAALEPSIHYKQLPVLMTNFAKTFDLGDLASTDDDKNESEGPAAAFIVHSTEKCSSEAKKRSQEFPRPIFVGNGQAHNGYERPTIDGAFPTRPMFVGDFSSDLVPGGLDPLRRTGPNDSTGSLMGPNHPMFQGGGMSGVGNGSGFGMQPRFDPFGPPGGPQDIPPGGPVSVPPHLRPRGSGEPNKDHLRPPNSLGNNMFC